MEVNEQQVYEALGVEQPAQEQTPQETEQPQAQPPQGEMSLEQRRENAARRRRAETRAAIQEAVEAERSHTRRDVEQVLRDAALRSPVDGTPITNLEQYRAFKQAQQAKPAPRPHCGTGKAGCHFTGSTAGPFCLQRSALPSHRLSW